jgi:hypothetical protein
MIPTRYQICEGDNLQRIREEMEGEVEDELKELRRNGKKT